MKNIVITGSTKGIGFGLAREFVKRGHSVAISGRNTAEVEAAVRTLGGVATSGARVAGMVCDVAKVADVQALWDQAKATLGQVDIWINNAGFARTGVKLAELTDGELETMVQSNIIGTSMAISTTLLAAARMAACCRA